MPKPTKQPIKHLDPRPLRVIAAEIKADIAEGNWTAPARKYAMPYLLAMDSLDSIHDRYLVSSGKSVVRYFLSNASTWRGETARRIKLELKGMLL